MYDNVVVVSGRVGAFPSHKYKLGELDFSHFPFYVTYIDSLHKKAIDGTKIHIFLTRKLAEEYYCKITTGQNLRIEGTLSKKPFIDDYGISRVSEVIYADFITEK